VRVLKGSGVMNRCASAVMTTRTSAPALTSSDARSAALCAAIDPVTPRTMFFLLLISVRSTLKFRRLGAADPHLFRFDDRQGLAQVGLFAPADQKIIEILPLRDLLFGHGQAALDDRRGVGPAPG